MQAIRLEEIGLHVAWTHPVALQACLDMLGMEGRCKMIKCRKVELMKKLILALLAGNLMIPFLQQPALAHKRYTHAKVCYKNQYVEKYHPGTRENPGYVSSREVMVERPCPKNMHFHGKRSHKHREGYVAHDHHSHSITTTDARPVVVKPGKEDNNSCLEGTVAGGVLGGALGGVLAKKENWIWSIPAGAVGGALVGCQVDGG